MTQTINASAVRSNWSKLLNKVFRGETDVVVEESGIPVAAIVSTEDYEDLKRLKEQRKQDFALLRGIREAFAKETPEQIQTGVSESIAQSRAERAKPQPPKA